MMSKRTFEAAVAYNRAKECLAVARAEGADLKPYILDVNARLERLEFLQMLDRRERARLMNERHGHADNSFRRL